MNETALLVVVRVTVFSNNVLAYACVVMVVMLAPSETADGAVAVKEPVILAVCIPLVDPILSAPRFLNRTLDPIVTLPVLCASSMS